MQRVRLIVLDDPTLMWDALMDLLEPEFQAVGIFEDGHTLVASAPGLNPGVTVLGIECRR